MNKPRRKFLTKPRSCKQKDEQAPDFTDEELWGVAGDPKRRGRAYMCRDPDHRRLHESEQPEVILPDTLIGEMQAEFDMDLLGD